MTPFLKALLQGGDERGTCRNYIRTVPPRMENQMDKKMDNDMETGFGRGGNSRTIMFFFSGNHLVHLEAPPEGARGSLLWVKNRGFTLLVPEDHNLASARSNIP